MVATVIGLYLVFLVSLYFIIESVQWLSANARRNSTRHGSASPSREARDVPPTRVKVIPAFDAAEDVVSASYASETAA